jgi:hypothetical protein
LAVSIDRTLGNIAVRLIDVHPDGTSHQVSWGALNLAHRHDNENLSEMTPGNSENVAITLDECGYKFLAGHRIRLSISTAYWPMIMPSPELVTAIITLGQHSTLSLPIRQIDDAITIEEPEDLNPLPGYVSHQQASHNREVKYDLQQGLTHYKVFDDTGEHEEPEHGMRSRHTYKGHWSINPNDPLSSVAHNVYTCYLSRGDWCIHTESESGMRCDQDNYYIKAAITAYKNDSVVNVRNWESTSNATLARAAENTRASS